MAGKPSTKTTKRGKRVKNLPAKSITARQAKGIAGGQSLGGSAATASSGVGQSSWIEVDSFSFGATNPGPGTAGGASAGKVSSISLIKKP